MGILNNILKTKDGQAEKDAAKPAEKKAEPTVANVAAEPEKVKVVRSEKVVKHEDPRIYKIVQHPHISEKATDLSALNKYVFIIPVEATKKDVTQKITNLYGVKPVKVNMIRRAGKMVMARRTGGQKKDFKKVIVTFAPGAKVEVYAGV